MDRIQVVSSTVASIGYDSESQTLEMEFTSGRVYQYKEVPPEVARGLICASSKGRYFNGHIKNSYATVEI